jgi:hypothetical protein
MNQVLQSGMVTPGHLMLAVTDGVIGDAGVTFNNTLGEFRADFIGVNFNVANTDFPILINLPAGYTRWIARFVRLSAASGTLTTATCGVFTGPGATGLQIVSSGSAITVNTNLADTNNNAQVFTTNNSGTLAYSSTEIYFRVQTPQGNTATGNVSVFYEPLP